MKSRVVVLAAGAAAVAAVAVGLTARGQAPAGAPQYYQGKVSPPPPGLFPGAPAAERAPAPPPPAPRSGPLPPPAMPAPARPVNSPPPARSAPQPKLSQPVMAGADGVRQVSATEPGAPGSHPGAHSGAAPAFFITPAKNTEPAPLPDPKPLNLAPVPPALLPAPPPPSAPVMATSAAPVLRPPPPVDVPAVTPSDVVRISNPPIAPSIMSEPENLPEPKVTTSPFQEPPATLPAPVMTERGLPLPSRAAPAVTVEVLVPESVGVGQSLSYELVVKNGGPTAVTGVRVENDLPAHAQLLGTDPAAESAGERLTWILGSLEAGTERRIRVTVRPGEEGELQTRAGVTSTTAVEARARVTRPKLTVALVGQESARVGERVPFQIKLSNSGSGPAGVVKLQAKFTDGLSHAAGSIIETELKDLAAGQTRSFTLEVAASLAGAQNCLITAVADGSPAEPARAVVTVVEPLLVLKQSGPAHCFVRGEPVFTLELTNPGTAATDAVQVWAALPVGFELVQASDGGAFLDANKAVGWRLGALAPGGVKQLSMRLKAVSPTDGVIRTVAQSVPPEGMIAQASAGAAPTPGPRPLETRAETSIKAEGVPALRFEVSDVEDPVPAGKEAVYEIRVMNQGTGPCTNVQLVAELAEGTTATGTTGPTTGRATGQQIAFEPIPQFGVKGEAVYRLRVKSQQPGDARLRVRVSCDEIRTPIIKEENTHFTRD